jgi:hypothetical protein
VLSGTKISSVGEFSAFAEENKSWFREIDAGEVNGMCQRLELSCTSDARGWALLEFPDMFIVFNSTADKIPAIYFLSAAIKLGKKSQWNDGMEINYYPPGNPLILLNDSDRLKKEFQRGIEFVFRFKNASGAVVSKAAFRNFRRLGNGETDNGEIDLDSGFSGFVILASTTTIDFSQIVRVGND